MWVVNEALKKSNRSGSQIEEGEVQTLVNNWRNHPYIQIRCVKGWIEEKRRK